MTATTLVARANEGDGTDQLAGFSTTTGFAAAVVPTTQAGTPYDGTTPFPVAIMSAAGAIPVSLTSLPLPTGAATAAGQASIVTALGTPLQAGGTVNVGNLPAIQAVSAAVLPLPAGAATETTLATVASAIKAEDTPSADGDLGMVMLAQRRDSDTTTVSADGDYATLKMDEAGRLKVAAQPANYELVTGNITANGQSVAFNCSRGSNVIAHVVATTLVGHNASFEGSIDSTNGTDGAWFSIDASRTNANTVEVATGVLAATPAYGWELSVNGLNWMRVRATAHTSGTATWKFQQAPYATEPVPRSVVTAAQPVSGSVTATLAASVVRAGFVAGAGIWYDDSAATLAANATFTGTARDATVTATATAFANAATYAQEVRACAESDVAGTLWLEVSRDNVNWRRIRSVAAVAIAGGGFAAELIYRPAWRHWRVGYSNGAAAQTRFAIGSVAMAL